MDAIPRHILWSKDQIDLSDEWQRRWYIRHVLMYGRAEDVASLDWDEVERLLPELHLPPCCINSGVATSMLAKQPIPHGTVREREG